MSTYELIKEKSVQISWRNKDISQSLDIVFPVSENHPRYKVISKYHYFLAQLSAYHFSDNPLVICDEGVRNLLKKDIVNPADIIFVDPTEGKLKTLSGAKVFVGGLANKGYKKVVVIGGGVVINFGGYVAEQLNVDLVYVPTTVIGMSDASIGGKVRINDAQGDVFKKHAYKTFYEPSQIIIDPTFLKSLNEEQIQIGLAETIKHSIYQSDTLLDYLLSNDFNPFNNRESLLKTILWTADLKRICLEIDPGESKDGSYKILRAAHDISDRLEEESKFTLPHGRAVEIAMIQDLKGNPGQLSKLLQIYKKLGIEIPVSD